MDHKLAFFKGREFDRCHLSNSYHQTMPPGMTLEDKIEREAGRLIFYSSMKPARIITELRWLPERIFQTPSEKSVPYGLLTAGLCSPFALRTKAESKVAKLSQSLLDARCRASAKSRPCRASSMASATESGC